MDVVTHATLAATIIILAGAGSWAATLRPGDGVAYIDALATTNRFCPVRCASEIFEPESTEDLGRWMRTRGQEHDHITIKGGGHSYGCQSVPRDGFGMIHTKRLSKAEVVVRSDGTAFARLGAGLTFQDFLPQLSRMGYSIPHGECITVGVAGWLLNAGNHPETSNYKRLYEGGQAVLTKVTAVDYDGNVVVIDKSGINFVDDEPSWTLLWRRWTTHFLAGLLDLWGLVLVHLQDMVMPSSGPVMRIMQLWGSSLMVATEFEVELLPRKEPAYWHIVYDMDLFKENATLLNELWQIVVDDPENVTCGLYYATALLPGGTNGVGLKCIDWSDQGGANIFAVAPLGYTMARTIPHNSNFVWSKDSYGMGWTPHMVGEEGPEFMTRGGVEKWRQVLLRLSHPANPCQECTVELHTSNDLKESVGIFIALTDIICGAPLTNQNACSVYSSETLRMFVDGYPMLYKQNLPNCRANDAWRWDVVEYRGSYLFALAAKKLWDTRRVVDFWLGIGHDNNHGACEATHRQDVGATCAAHGITADDLVEAVKRDSVSRCPDLFRHDSMIDQNTFCPEHWENAKELPIIYEHKSVGEPDDGECSRSELS